MKILYADEAIIVVEKPGGLLAVPGRGPHKQDCVVSHARRLYPDLPSQPAVHRLDMFTSGVMILARNRAAHRHLTRQFEKRVPQKKYMALLDGLITGNQGRIELKFRLDVDNRPYQVYDPIHGKTSITIWHKVAVEGQRTRVIFTPLTGRTHQLRLHAAHPLGLSSPIVGDSLYGNGQDGDKMFLHAWSLRIIHPASEKVLTFFSAVPF